MTVDPTLAVIWACILAIGFLIYVVLDGFDLGIGMLFGVADSEHDRRVMMNSVAPIWDGNETWLILGGAGLFAAFPMVYASLLPALYLPVIIMLMALIMRGVAFEFRYKATGGYRTIWDLGFVLGSGVASFCQGAALGTLMQGLPIENGQYAGGPFIWFNAFSIYCGFGLMAGYMLLGATWLVLKTEGGLQEWSYRRIRPLMIVVSLFLLVGVIWMLIDYSHMGQRWWRNPAFLLLPLGGLVTAWLLWRSVDRRQELMPFWAAAAGFGLAFVALAFSFWPYVIPPSVTIYDAASVSAAQTFMLHGMAILLPIVLIYTCFVYWIFRGKATAEIEYD